MKNKIGYLLGALLFISCGGGGNPGDDIVISNDNINVTPNLSLLGDGQETDLLISATCNWTITVSSNWLTVTPESGSKTQNVKVSAGKNSTGSERTATLKVKGGTAPVRTVTVTQAKGSEQPALSTNTTSLDFEAIGDSKTFLIYSNVRWNISKPDWCECSETTGMGNTRITVTASDNPLQEQRFGSIVISGEGVSSVTIAVNQKARNLDNTQIPDLNDNTPPN